nr:DUF3021 family protein [Maliibacterium massiliense]
MKKLLDFSMMFKPVMALYFSILLFFYMLADLLWLKSGAVSTATLWQVLLVSLALSLLQQLVVNNTLLPRLSTAWRSVLHLALCYALLLGCALLFGWFGIGSAGSIALFSVCFLAAYAVMYAGWALYYWCLAGTLNAQLAHYKRSAH